MLRPRQARPVAWSGSKHSRACAHASYLALPNSCSERNQAGGAHTAHWYPCLHKGRCRSKLGCLPCPPQSLACMPAAATPAQHAQAQARPSHQLSSACAAADGEVLLYDPRKLDQSLGSLTCSELGEPVTALSWQQERLSRSHSSGLPPGPQPQAASRGSLDACKLPDVEVGTGPPLLMPPALLAALASPRMACTPPGGRANRRHPAHKTACMCRPGCRGSKQPGKSSAQVHMG